MRIASVALLITCLGGCSSGQPKSGWEYSPTSGAYEPRLAYRFSDADNTTLIGSCEGEPHFMMAYGNWEGPEFTVTADGKSWRFHTSQSELGHYLVVDGYEANHAIANAATGISFQVGNWRRELKPAEPLRKFVADCSYGQLSTHSGH